MKIYQASAAAVLLTGLVATGIASAQPRGGGGGGGPFGNVDLRIDDIGNGIYQIISSASGGITVFTSDDGVMLVDTKFDREYDRYMELLRTVTDQPVRFVVNTHMHPDHTGGNALLEGLGSDIVATENARRRLAEAQATGLPNITFDDHMRLYFGGRAMDLYWFGRGHTDGDLVIHLPDEGLVVAGDLFAGGDPFVRLIDYNGGGSLAEWSGTLEQVLELDFDRVIPGHTEVTDRARMQAYHDEIVAMQDLIREMHEAGRAPADIQQAVVNEFGNFAFVVLPGIEAVIAELD